jgi:hypothetical protein
MSAEQYGSIVAVYGCQPCDPTPKPWKPADDLPWYPSGSGDALPDVPITPPRECERCHHLFPTVREWNEHVDACLAKHGGAR